jgi:hypothetical protein
MLLATLALVIGLPGSESLCTSTAREVTVAVAPLFPDDAAALRGQSFAYRATARVSAGGVPDQAAVVATGVPYEPLRNQVLGAFKQWRFASGEPSDVAVTFRFALYERDTPIERLGTLVSLPCLVEVRRR